MAISDAWANAEAYERYMGRWSSLVALDFVQALDVPPGQRWLDAGCGTGRLTATLLSAAAPAAVVGVDASAAFLAYARQQVTDAHARFEVADLQALPFEDGTFAAAVAGLVLNFVPDPPAAVRELARVVEPGGVVAAYVWDYAGEMQFQRYFWNAAAALDPAAAALDQGRRFPLCRPAPLAAIFTGAGLHAVAVRAVDVPTIFRDFDDYWQPFLAGQGPAPQYLVSLPPAARTALAAQLRETLPFAADGSLPLIARAWAVRGLR